MNRDDVRAIVAIAAALFVLVSVMLFTASVTLAVAVTWLILLSGHTIARRHE